MGTNRRSALYEVTIAYKSFSYTWMTYAINAKRAISQVIKYFGFNPGILHNRDFRIVAQIHRRRIEEPEGFKKLSWEDMYDIDKLKKLNQ